uniref:Uncharacterized protein n=1 Tax=Entomoneis paludosa TaxID=265537 RepID=A0A7S3DN47_9STRA
MDVTSPKTQTGKKSMELIANIPIGAYAQDCNLLLSEEEMQTGNQVLERHGGHAMPWLAMGRVCRRNDNDNSDPSRQRFLRQLDADDTDKLFDVQADRFLCGQGHRTTVNDQQAYCFHQNNCASLEVCNGPNGCTGAPSCDIASETVRAEMIDLVGNDGSDSVDDDEDPDCIFERILPYDRMWDLAASQMDQKPPSLDTPEVPGQP